MKRQKFLERHTLPKLTEENNLNNSILIKDLDFIFRNKENPDGINGEFYKTHMWKKYYQFYTNSPEKERKHIL